MEHAIHIGAPENAGDIHIFGEILTQSLRFPPVEDQDWMTRIGTDQARIAKRGGHVLGGAILVRMGQFFGPEPLPMVGIHGVAVAPEYRATGVGRALMAGVVQELHADRVPLSVLYPATQKVYRRAGYEQAGCRIRYEARTAALSRCHDDVTLEPVTENHRPVLESLYRRRARRNAGHVDRIDWGWQRILNPRMGAGYAYLAFEGSNATGYISFIQSPENMPMYRVEILDWTAETAATARRLLSLVADHRSMSERFTWYGAPNDPFLFALREQQVDIAWRMIWMLRICHFEEALVARAFPEHVDAELHLDLDDALLPGQSGRWVVRVKEGRADLSRGGRGEFAIDVRGLAALYAGYLNAQTLVCAGLASGGAKTCATADDIFRGPPPWMTDMF